jgi:lycopene beta-cyclase
MLLSKETDANLKGTAELLQREVPVLHGLDSVGFYDYIFIGAGASATLLMLAMEQKNLLRGKKVLIADPEPKHKNDKTFCFWALNNEPIVENLAPLISKSWKRIRTNHQPNPAEIHPYAYFHISSADLYNSQHQLASSYQWERILQPVEKIFEDGQGTYLNIENKILRAGQIFDSRPPDYRKPEGNQVHLFQSFTGWKITTANHCMDADEFHFMDFSIPQNGKTQFVYILPFSSCSALVEVTRFGDFLIDPEEAEEILHNYILGKFGNYTIESVERGCIPMSNACIHQENKNGVWQLGARNYHVKPSTGYAFKNMYEHAGKLAEHLKNPTHSDDHNLRKKFPVRSRFSFYDALLLKILKSNPEKGKTIFSSLLKKTGLQLILKFLDEKTSLKEEISIFAQLPVRSFLIAFFQFLVHKNWLRPVFITFICLVLIVCGMQPALQANLGYSILAIGLVIVGIPHGAVDHLIESGRWGSKNTPEFIAGYLSKGIAMAVFWYIFPQAALLIFLIFSAWHFGQADGNQWKISETASFLWGISVLVYILGTHAEETNQILSALNTISLPVNCPVWGLTPWLLWALANKKRLLAITIVWLSLTSALPLIMAFGIYFIGQHSITGGQQICSHLRLNYRQVWIQSIPFHFGAWLLMGIFFFVWPFFNDNAGKNNWAQFFTFIACLSLPHVLVMKNVYRKNNHPEKSISEEDILPA